MQLNKIHINYEADIHTGLQNKLVNILNKNGAIETNVNGDTISFIGASAFKNTSLNPLVGITKGKIQLTQNKIEVELTCNILMVYFYIVLAIMCISFLVLISQFENSLKSYLMQFGFTILLFGSYFFNRFFIYSKFKSMLKGI